MRRIIYGALAGCAATVAMTAAMRRLHPLLPPEERYPLPPREIIAGARLEPPRAASAATGSGAGRAMIAHFCYGALTGGLFALQGRRGFGLGAAYGAAVWLASYLGWVPSACILRPATRHPQRRNALMLGVHLVWGLALAIALREIEIAEGTAFRRAGGDLPDLPPRRS